MGEIKGKSTANNATPPDPVSYAGKWVAWTEDGSEIVASARTLRSVQLRATRAGHPGAIFERIPRNLEPIQGVHGG